MAAYADYQTYLAAAQTAFAAGDYDGARKQVILARMSLAQIPNSSSDGTSTTWREDLNQLEMAITAESGRTTSSVSVPSEFTAG